MNISNSLKEAREVISDGLLIAMVLKGLPPNFKPFTMVITQKKKTLTFSEFKACLRSSKEAECMCYLSTDESNNILQMKTTFKKINPRNKLGVSTHSCYDYKSTNYNYNNYQKPQHSREDYKTSPLGKTNIIYVCGKRGHKAFQFKNQRQKDFCQNIRTYIKGQTYFFALGYDIVSDKSELLVNCSATEHITDKSKFINFDQNFEPGYHFVELADRSRANNIVLKRGNACIYLCNSKGYMYRYVLKNALYIHQCLNKIYFQYKQQQKIVHT